jgi:hypothetical protein
MRARWHTGQGSIPISISISTMIWLIGNPSYPYTYPYTYPYSPHHRVRKRVPLRWVRVRLRAELELVRKGQCQSKTGIAICLPYIFRGFVPSCEIIPGTLAPEEPDASHEATKQWPPKQHTPFHSFAEWSASAGARLFRAGSSWSRRLMQCIPNRHAYDDLLQTPNLLGALGVLGGSSYGVGHCRVNCPLEFDSVSLMRKGRGIQPPRRQDAKNAKGEGTPRLDMTGERYGWGRARLRSSRDHQLR